jgi:hypothetical protein
MICVAGSVASGSFIGQTGDLSSSVIATPENSGMYRINIAGEQTSGNSEIAVFMTWTNDAGTWSAQVNKLQFESGCIGNSSPVYLTGGNPVSLYTTTSYPPMVYNLYYSLESL